MESPHKENVQVNYCTTAKEEEFLLTGTSVFYAEEFEDDEVFLDDSQSTDMDRSSDNPVRTRRTSDVIDCHGGPISPAQIHKRHSFPSTSGEVVYSATSKATNINNGLSRRSELVTEPLDLGYSSPGPRSLKGGWFRFSTSNDSDSVDARPHTNCVADEQILNPPNSNK